MGNLLTLTNVLLNKAFLSGRKNKERVVLWAGKNDISKYIGRASDRCYDSSIVRFPLAELDLLVKREKKHEIIIDSFELKLGGNSILSRATQRQLIRQGILLTLVSLDGFHIYSNNVCMSLDDLLYRKPIRIYVRFLGGHSEKEVSNYISSQEFRDIYRNSYLFSDIFISNSRNICSIEYKCVFPNNIVGERLEFHRDMINYYRSLIMGNYKSMVEDFINSNGNRKISDILKNYDKTYGNLDLKVFSWP